MSEYSPTKSEAAMRPLLQRIATGPELSKDLSLDEARLGMRLILDGAVDPVQAGVFLIALRMKRETDDENCGVLDAIRECTDAATAAVDEVLDLADPYDGCTRSLPASPFLPALLAACGVPTVAHGVESVGPKYGVTHHRVLAAAGVDVAGSPSQVAARLANPAIGWGYVDQSRFCPKLYALNELRTLIVKRPAITTAEVLASPVRGRRHTHLMTGYVHKAYPRKYALLARHAGFESALLVRGTEGGVIPSLRQPAQHCRYTAGGAEHFFDSDPERIGIHASTRAVPLPESNSQAETGEESAGNSCGPPAAAAAAAGLAALEGHDGPARDSLVLGCALALWHLGRAESLDAAADTACDALDSGAAAARFRAAFAAP